jgi:hypothetical protein
MPPGSVARSLCESVAVDDGRQDRIGGLKLQRDLTVKSGLALLDSQHEPSPRFQDLLSQVALTECRLTFDHDIVEQPLLQEFGCPLMGSSRFSVVAFCLTGKMETGDCGGRSRRGEKVAAVFVVRHRRRSCGMGVAGGPAFGNRFEVRELSDDVLENRESGGGNRGPEFFTTCGRVAKPTLSNGSPRTSSARGWRTAKRSPRLTTCRSCPSTSRRRQRQRRIRRSRCRIASDWSGVQFQRTQKPPCFRGFREIQWAALDSNQ